MTAISHYGVLGMKWGVRRDQATLDRKSGRKVTRATKKAAKKNTKAYREGIQSRANASFGPISEDRYKDLDGKKVLISKKGDSVYRVSGTHNTDVSGKSYVSTNAKDNDVYVALLAPSGQEGAQKVQLNLSVNENLVSPSKKERIDSFVETLDMDVSMASLGQDKVVKGRDFVSSDPVDKALSDKELGLKYYNRFVQNQVMNTPLHEKHFQNIQSKGYNALIDDADAGIVTDLPVILFDSGKSVTVSTKTNISKDDIVFARERLS